MCILEYDEEKTLNGRLETGIRIGREEERTKKFEEFGGLVADGLISIEEAAKRTGVSVAEFRRLTGL